MARREAIPKKFLEQILLKLNSDGLVVSKKGRGGGYSLARSPETVTLGEAIRLMEGHWRRCRAPARRPIESAMNAPTIASAARAW